MTPLVFLGKELEMTPPRKKTPSLQDLLESNENQSPEETTTEEENTSEVGTHANVEEPGSEVVEDGDPVDRQADANPDGVTFSGNQNVMNKTPAELASETPEETKQRFGINEDIPDAVHDDPNVTANRDMGFKQIPSGTHLHPDVAKDNYNRGIGSRTEHGEVTRTVSESVYALPAEVDDKGRNEHFNDEDNE